ncbi:hypothetical protein MBLNU457_g2767t1 [Dothideomycetes sp. NU457]
MTADASYIDYETFLDPSFSATSFANTLVLATNDPSDTPLDLSTPLSRVLFDVQEVDTHIDTLTTKSALPLLEYTQDRANASTHILEEVEAQVASLTEGYKRLEKDVIERYEAAEQVHLAAERLCQTVKLGRSVARCLQYARQLEVEMEELGPATNVQPKKDGYRAMVPAAHTLLSMRHLFSSTGPGGEGEGLDRINVITTVRNDLVASADRALLGRAQQTIREFSMSSLLASNPSLNAPPSSGTPTSAPTFAQAEDTKSRTTSALNTLYLLSPLKTKDTASTFEPTLLISALQTYLQTALTSSLASLARALATLPTLDRTLLEISARCQNVVALEALLSSTRPPTHPLLSTSTTDQTNDDNDDDDETRTLLQPLLAHLDTSSLPSYFWRTLSSNLSPRVTDIMNKGGVSARTLRTNKDRVAAAVRECVAKGSRVPAVGLVGKASAGGQVGNWEREAAVMVGSIIGPLGRY